MHCLQWASRGFGLCSSKLSSLSAKAPAAVSMAVAMTSSSSSLSTAAGAGAGGAGRCSWWWWWMRSEITQWAMGHQRRHVASALRDREYFVPQRATVPTWSQRLFPGGGISGDTAIGALIAANLGIFAAWQLAEGGAARRFMQRHFLCSDAAVTRDWRVHTLFTCSLSHVEFWHLASNLLALYFFGRSVGAHIGGRRLLMLYAGGGVLGSAAHIAYYRMSAQQERRQRRRRLGGDLFLYEFFRDSPPVLGASAAINAIVAYDILCFPMKIIMVNLVIPMPAAVLGGLFLSRDIFFAINGGAASRESHAAHIAGAAVGSAAYLLLSRGRIRRM